jgi:hypothetical protein
MDSFVIHTDCQNSKSRLEGERRAVAAALLERGRDERARAGRPVLGLSATGQHYFSNKSATNNESAVRFSQNKSAPPISHQPNKQAGSKNFLYIFILA